MSPGRAGTGGQRLRPRGGYPGTGRSKGQRPLPRVAGGYGNSGARPTSGGDLHPAQQQRLRGAVLALSRGA
jgi:hypothetical protein